MSEICISEKKFDLKIVGDETVFLNPENGDMIVLNQTATEVYNIIIKGNTNVEEIVASLTDEYNVSYDECKTEVEKCLEQLRQKNIVK